MKSTGKVRVVAVAATAVVCDHAPGIALFFAALLLSVPT